MKSITEIIKPIKLLAGTHQDTDVTGQGCFMNVIAYLNGEPQITDESECVCVTIRPIAIWLNDRLPNEKRHKLLPFIERAMGSATEDRALITARLVFIVKFAQDCDEYAAKYAKYAAEHAAKYAESAAEHAANYAEYAAQSANYAAKYAEYAAQSAAESANYDANYAEYAAIMELGLKLMDDICPKPKKFKPETYERAEKIVSLQEV